MLVEVKVPMLSESISDAVLLQWRKQQGDYIGRDENLIDLETDKVVLEITAPSAGVLTQIKKQAGEHVGSEEVIALIDADAKPATAGDTGAAAADQSPPPVSAGAGPAARKWMAEHQIEAGQVAGTGKGDRVTKADVIRFLDQAQGNEARRPEPEPDPPVIPVFQSRRDDKRVPMTRLRARVSERLKQAQNTAAILTTFNEVTMQPVMDIRRRYKELFEKNHQVKLGMMSFFTKAVVEGLKQYPIINASVDGEDIIYHNYFDIGIAVGSPRGLVVPIVRDADALSLADIEKTIRIFSDKAKNASLSMEDLTGGTFTITNGGVFGSMLSTPILNPPQSAILGMHAIKERPVVAQGEICIRPVMYLALSYDHRIIDGQDAVQFLVFVKNALEDPTRLLLQV